MISEFPQVTADNRNEPSPLQTESRQDWFSRQPRAPDLENRQDVTLEEEHLLHLDE